MIRLKKLAIAIAGAAVVTLGISRTAQAATDFLSDGAGEVGTIDISSGIFSPFIKNGPVFYDLALSKDNNLFGAAFQELYSINQDTKSVSPIGSFFPFINALGFSSNNVLYGAGDSGFYTLNTSTGNASLVANIPDFTSSGAILFNPVSNQFWAISSGPSSDRLFSIGLDGKATQIGNIGFKSVSALSFENGSLFGYTQSNQQIVIDPTTGVGTFSKNVTGASGSIYGAASLPLTGSQPISEPPLKGETPSSPQPISEPPYTLKTPPSFTPPKSVPEPASTLGILAFGALGAGSLLKRQIIKHG